MRSLNLMCFSIIFLIVNVNCNTPTIRNTLNGPIEGVELTSVLDQKYYAFKGVRYAEAPITGKDPLSGDDVDRRFKVPDPIKRSWSDPVKADTYGKGCMQSPSIIINSSNVDEDCLFLNIYVPSGGSEKKPVLVFLHGGGWISGDGTDFFYGPDLLLTRDNVVVIVQYRLGIFGLLNLGVAPYPGNLALKDQQLALKWIWYNIENFSGNRRWILLFGESAGGSAVHFHVLNKESRKYFSSAFISSGSAFNAWKRENHVKLIQECSKSNDTNGMVEFLKTASSDSLLNCRSIVRTGIFDQLWLPTIENRQIPGAFLVQPPNEIDASNPPLPIDIIFSYNSQEAIVINTKLVDSTEPLITEDWQKTNLPFPSGEFTKENHPEEYKEVVEKLRDAYYPDPENGTAVRDGNIALLTNVFVSNFELYGVALHANINKLGKFGNAYFIRFSAHDAFNIVYLETGVKYEGATHTDDVCYMFYCRILDKFNIYHKHLEAKDKSYDLIMRWVDILSNFVRTGNPSIKGDTPFKSCRSSNEIYCQELSNSTKTSVTYDITKQLHFDVWLEIQKIYKNVTSQESKKTN